MRKKGLAVGAVLLAFLILLGGTFWVLVQKASDDSDFSVPFNAENSTVALAKMLGSLLLFQNISLTEDTINGMLQYTADGEQQKTVDSYVEMQEDVFILHTRSVWKNRSQTMTVTGSLQWDGTQKMILWHISDVKAGKLSLPKWLWKSFAKRFFTAQTQISIEGETILISPEIFLQGFDDLDVDEFSMEQGTIKLHFTGVQKMIGNKLNAFLHSFWNSLFGQKGQNTQVM